VPLILLLVVLVCAIACIIVVVDNVVVGSNGDVAVVVDTSNVRITLTVITNNFLFVDIFWLLYKD